MYVVQLSGLLSKQFNTNYVRNGTRLASTFGRHENYGRFREYRKRIAVWLKQQSGQVAEACARQFEFIAAQRVRRSMQIFHLYTRMWDEAALKEFMKSWRNRTLRNTRHFLMSSIGVTMYNWDRERISEEELNSFHALTGFVVSYKQEIEGIHRLRDSTVICAICHQRIVIDVRQPGIKYCTCYGNKFSATANEGPQGWRPYIEREDMLIWRREEPNFGGLFAYKVYGSFDDVTAEDFLQTQIDVDYRMNWDSSARELQIIDTDPKSQTSSEDSTDVIYWETIWPKLFANRDYVYQRRWVVDKDKRLIIIINKVTEHPNAPTKPGVYRVTTYWSYMVIRPYTEFHQPGIEFGLTYFDDPGVNIPSAVTSWVAMSGLPNFLIRMRHAAKNYQSYKRTKKIADPSTTNYASFQNEDASGYEVIPNNNGTETLEKSEASNEKVAEESNFDKRNETLTFTGDQRDENDRPSNERTASTTNLPDERRGSTVT
ncbi:stAR-related lipid transfer protein 7, mitochondrial-like isoform X2 [Osmia bicornis bicornis]|uniref:stAR-related lipid transfer protein 7, mitochondrial-like isoform X2 n=1 Tax=Osmia bicornis bicornis TaxID=1437191 RepID=UPI001EAED9BB|nr:stAR-related lipid transfer protein 7, mitochondrial-like isoform X2 [Osmia bicornis bicornis]